MCGGSYHHHHDPVKGSPKKAVNKAFDPGPKPEGNDDKGQDDKQTEIDQANQPEAKRQVSSKRERELV